MTSGTGYTAAGWRLGPLHGEMAERTKATVSKTVESLMGFRGFESHSLRGERPSYSLDSRALIRGQLLLPAGSGEGWMRPFAAVGGSRRRFESHSLRGECPRSTLDYRALVRGKGSVPAAAGEGWLGPIGAVGG